MLLNDGGALAIEVHDLQRIVDRAEYCLFEHEHTIYLAADDLRFLLEASGFDIVSVNPIPDTVTRANSLIVIARKNAAPTSACTTGKRSASTSTRLACTLLRYTAKRSPSGAP